MKPGFLFLIVSAMALSGSIDLLAGHGQKPKTAQKETQRKAYPGCWPGEPEIENLNHHFTTQVSMWTFPPAERDEKRVRSFVPVAITLHLK